MKNIKASSLSYKADRTVALAGNPNVGKSTVFNALTGMHQHTGNWAGKTVQNAEGLFRSKEHTYRLVDLPGTYSLEPRSEEERVARDYVFFGQKDAEIVVCDATNLERGLKLLLQVLETGQKTLLCVNLMDEAKRKGIDVNINKMSQTLGIPIVGTSARSKKTLVSLVRELENMKNIGKGINIKYPTEIEQAIGMLIPSVDRVTAGRLDVRFVCVKLLSGDEELHRKLDEALSGELLCDPSVKKALETAQKFLNSQGITEEKLFAIISETFENTVQKICLECVTYSGERYSATDKILDKIFTGKYTAYPVVFLMLAIIFFITIVFANYPSEWLSFIFGQGEILLNRLFSFFNSPWWLKGILIDGVYKVMTWVIAVMLPPMAIFFPFFTLMEDAGVLPRIAYNLDRPLSGCNASGKQALTMCMGFGCNAVGITGCRIIDSKRERLLGILTNTFIPCNGRFPTIIALINIFVVGISGTIGVSILSALAVTAVITLSVVVTLGATKLLSVTVLKGRPEPFILELPSYRRPQIGKVLVRSLFDRTLFVLGRAVVVAAPAGAILWIAANVHINDLSLLQYGASCLEPFAKFLGMDGVILIAFILGFPANEIVIPIIVMAYSKSGSIVETGSLSELKLLLTSNGWTIATAISVILFSLMHWPCSTSVLTVKKETGSIKWTVFAIFFPFVVGVTVCGLLNVIVNFLT